MDYAFSFYFPSIGEYTSMLEQAEFRVIYVILFNRPTCCLNGENSLAKRVRYSINFLFYKWKNNKDLNYGQSYKNGYPYFVCFTLNAIEINEYTYPFYTPTELFSFSSVHID